VFVNQLLFGYARGHRLLAQSSPISSSDLATLLSATDASGDGDFFLTGLPLGGDRYALAVTWPAPELPRPGAVWSHVLLLERQHFKELSDLSLLLRAAHRPHGPDGLDQYSQRLEVLDDWPAGPPAAPPHLLEDVLSAVYLKSSGNILEVADLSTASLVLLSAWSQQWPALRARFAFQSRGTAKASDSRYDVTLARHVRGSTPKQVSPERFPWLMALADDLRFPGEGGALRRFLWEFGPSHAPRAATLASLTDLYLATEAQDRPGVLDRITRRYPRPSTGRKLKRALYGAARGLWGVPETARLADMVASGADAWDVNDLAVEQRAVSLVETGEWFPVVAAWNSGTPEALSRSLVAGMSPGLTPSLAASIAKVQGWAAAELMQHSPDVAQDPAFWHAVQLETARDVLASWKLKDIQPRLVASILEGGKGQSIVDWINAGRLSLDAVLSAKDAYRVSWPDLDNLLSNLGPPFEIRSQRAELIYSAWCQWAMVMDPPSPHRASALLASLEATRTAVDEVWLRAATLALATYAPSAASWRSVLGVVFGPLHLAVTSNTLPHDCWRHLDALLPASPDPSTRLRRLLVDRVRVEHWGEDDVIRALRGAGPFGEKVQEELSPDDPLQAILSTAVSVARRLKPW